MVVNIDDIRKSQRADGPATVLAIGTATPPTVVYQSTYPNYYFRVTNSQHMTQLKHKFKQICKHRPTFNFTLLPAHWIGVNSTESDDIRRVHVLRV